MKVIEDPAVAEAFGPNTLGVIGDFSPYVDGDGTHIDDSDICEDCGERHAWTVCREITKRGGKHRCRGCGDRWTETRGADAVDTVRWPGWLA